MELNKKHKFPFYPVGAVVKATFNSLYNKDEDKDETVIVIGHRIQCPRTKKVWDYVCVPLLEGFQLDYNDNSNNVMFFNHEDITVIVREVGISENT